MYDPQALKWMSALWFLVLQLAALPLAPVASASPCTLPSPRNVHFVSKNMKNILHWLPPEGIAEDELSYTVKYLIYGTNKWIKSSSCKNTSRTWCDLSLETYNHKELYHASVKAFSSGSCSSWAESLRFNPLTDSHIDPPAFAISSTETSISVIVVPPEKWKGDPKEKPEYLHQIYPDLQYNVSVFNKTIRKKWMFSIKNNRLDVLQLESNTVYCVTVQVYITPLLLSGYSKENCIATLKDPAFKQTTILLECILPVLLIGLFILVSSCCIYRYIHITEQTYPKNLVLKNSKKHQGDLFVPTEKTAVSFISVIIVDQCKALQEDIHLRGNAENFAGDRAGNNAEKETSKVPEDEHSHETCHNEEAVLENEQDGNGSRVTRLHSHDTRGQRQSEDVVVYEFDVRGEDATPNEEEQGELCLKENMGALGSLPKALSGLAMETEQSYCPQYDVGPPGAFSVYKLEELLSNKVVPVNLQVSLINLVALDQDFCPDCGVASDICLAPDKKEPFWDEKGVMLRETQALTFTMTRNTTTSYCSCTNVILPFVTLTSRDQEGAEGDHEQSTVIDWDPQTRAPFLLDLSSSTNEEITETEKCAELLEEGMLSRLYNRKCSDDLSEGDEEAYLLQLKEQWELEIQMQN
ncbi:interleukin-20 receptor subunit alpha [Tiliqua scincoides]|uniref:interleukin-20 receptor subunit alpha n=1 Tax=Tiliqua scincoides TaxID=71010 RepID=UPI003461D6C9